MPNLNIYSLLFIHVHLFKSNWVVDERWLGSHESQYDKAGWFYLKDNETLCNV